MNRLDNHPDDLLPWYVNGTLESAERDAIDTHLQSCSRCRREVQWLQNLRVQIKDTSESGPGEFALKRLLRDAASEKSSASRRNRWWQPALAAAAVIIVIQSAMLIGMLNRPSSITPLGGPPVEGVVLQVRFAPHATEEQIRQLLQKTQATLIGGPGALGIYRVRLDNVTPAQDRVIERTIGEFSADHGVVTYAARE